jgi:hypothetical protein
VHVSRLVIVTSVVYRVEQVLTRLLVRLARELLKDYRSYVLLAKKISFLLSRRVVSNILTYLLLVSALEFKL